MTDWIALDQLAIARGSLESNSERGVRIDIAVSPFDVPEALRGSFDATINRFVIEFKYMQDDPWIRQEGDEHLALRVGRHSGRLYGIEVDLAALDAAHLALRLKVPEIVEEMLERMSAEKTPMKRRFNYRVLRNLVEQEEPKLFAELVRT